MASDFVMTVDERFRLDALIEYDHKKNWMPRKDRPCTFREAFECAQNVNLPIIRDGRAYHYAMTLYLQYRARENACNAACKAFCESPELPVEIYYKICTQYVLPSRHMDCWELK